MICKTLLSSLFLLLISQAAFADFCNLALGSVEQLKKIGFKQIDESPWFFQGPFLISFNDPLKPKIYFSDEKRITSIHREVKPTEYGWDNHTFRFTRFFQYPSDPAPREMETIFSISNSLSYNRSIDSDSVRLSSLREGGLRSQLEQIGFKSESQNRSVYTMTYTEAHPQSLDIAAAFTSDGEIQIFTARKSIQALIAEGTEVLNFEIKQTGFGPQPALKIKNPLMTFEVGQYGFVQERSQELLMDLKDVNSEVFKYNPILPKLDASSRFVIGGTNSTETVKNLKSINSISISVLEKAMRPKQDSFAGFLGEEESLLDVMAEDNNTVLNKLRLTHAQIGEALRRIVAASDAELLRTFTFHGRRYQLARIKWMGTQGSPFNDQTQTDSDFGLTNLDNGKVIGFSGLLPELISRYGFYEGKGTRYRVSPTDIVEVLDFLKN